MPRTPLLQRLVDRLSSPRSPTNLRTTFARFGRQSKVVRVHEIRKAGKPKNAVVTYGSAQQEVALNQIMDDVDTTLVVILPADGGKKLLFTASTCLDDPGMIVIVTTYRRLTQDKVRNARALRIDCLGWTFGVEDPATIVLISTDRLSRRFFDYVGRMRSKRLLRKIYIDECRLAFIAHNWLPTVVESSEVARHRCTARHADSDGTTAHVERLGVDNELDGTSIVGPSEYGAADYEVDSQRLDRQRQADGRGG
jgi:hypothetical protein